MKVVLFCGGLGLRLKEVSDKTPKPLVTIGYRPIIWHLMKYYAYFGHKEFVLCLGYKAGSFKEYFLNYNECDSNDFTLSSGGKKILLHNKDINDWKISFVDTGMHSNIGQRLMAVKKFVQDDEMFLANYSDGLTDMDLSNQIEKFKKNDKVAAFLSVKPNLSYHVPVTIGKNDVVDEIKPFNDLKVRINGGYFIFKRKIFDYMKEGEELVLEPFNRLVKEKQLVAYDHDGFWGCMDTFKDKQILDDLYEKGKAPWELWRAK